VVSIHRHLGYGPSALPLRHSANSTVHKFRLYNRGTGVADLVDGIDDNDELGSEIAQKLLEHETELIKALGNGFRLLRKSEIEWEGEEGR
jgi:hypothetical protein